MDWQERSRRLAGDEKLARLGKAHVVLFGLGGVGSFAAEALARSGIGRLSLVEYDLVSDTNRNRQLPALTSTLGRSKIEVCAARLKDINPELELFLYPWRMTAENLPLILGERDGAGLDGHISGAGESGAAGQTGETETSGSAGQAGKAEARDKAGQAGKAEMPGKTGGRPDFIADAIDDLPAKVALIKAAGERGLPIISALGAGFRLDPARLLISDISETHTCPLARRLRRELRAAGFDGCLPVVWSKEKPLLPVGEKPALSRDDTGDVAERQVKGPASMIFVPAAAGLLLASHIVRQL